MRVGGGGGGLIMESHIKKCIFTCENHFAYNLITCFSYKSIKIKYDVTLQLSAQDPYLHCALCLIVCNVVGGRRRAGESI